MLGRSGLLLRELRGGVVCIFGRVAGRGSEIYIPWVFVFFLVVGGVHYMFFWLDFSELVSSVYTSVTICWKRGWTRRMADGHDGRRKRHVFFCGGTCRTPREKYTARF